ncbi:unnamed protein product, partial [Didymodactylos carnosus]
DSAGESGLGDGLHGVHNRMTYFAVSDEKEATCPQRIKKRESVSSTASFAHIFAVCHLFGDIEYQFRDESDDESVILNSQEQTLNS